MSPFEGAARGFRQDRQERLLRYETIQGQFVKDQLQEPASLKGYSLGDMMHSSALHRAHEADHHRQENLLATASSCGDASTVKRNQASRPTVPFPPDRCQLAYGPATTRI